MEGSTGVRNAEIMGRINVNCGGQHRVTFGGCEVRKRAVKIEQVKAVNNISYAEAVNRVQIQREKEDTRKMNLIPRTERDRTEETNIALAADKLILFMAYVINCTDQVKHKTEKIKLIVRGAEKFMGLKDVSWEQITKSLEADGRIGGSGDKTR